MSSILIRGFCLFSLFTFHQQVPEGWQSSFYVRRSSFQKAINKKIKLSQKNEERNWSGKKIYINQFSIPFSILNYQFLFQLSIFNFIFNSQFSIPFSIINYQLSIVNSQFSILNYQLLLITFNFNLVLDSHLLYLTFRIIHISLTRSWRMTVLILRASFFILKSHQ